MTIEWDEPVASRQGTYVSFKAHGDGVTGWIDQFDPQTGGTTYDGADCGYAQILDDQGDHWIVELDNNLKRDRFAALAATRGTYVDIRYRGDIESKSGRTYKDIAFKKAVASPPMPAPKMVEPGADEEPF